MKFIVYTYGSKKEYYSLNAMPESDQKQFKWMMHFNVTSTVCGSFFYEIKN